MRPPTKLPPSRKSARKIPPKSHTIRNDPRQRQLALRKRAVEDPYAEIKSRIVNVEDIVKPMRLAVYGRAGSGKTTLASTFPAPLLIDFKDEGTDSVADVKGLKVLPAVEWEDVESLYWFLESGKHDFKTVILDTVTQMQEFAIKAVLGRKKKKIVGQAGDWGTMTKQDWGETASLMKTWIMHYRSLPINVVFIAQDRLFNSGDEGDDMDDQIQPEMGPRLSPSVASTLNAAVDLLVNSFVREDVKRTRVAGKIVQTKKPQFCLRVGPHASFITKIRKPRSFSVPRFMVDASYEELVELVKGE